MRRQALPLAPCSSSTLSSLAALPPLLQKASEPTHFNGAGSGKRSDFELCKDNGTVGRRGE